MEKTLAARQAEARTLPLAGVRVVELSDKAQACGRMLADLGADVVLVEPPGGCAARVQPPLHAGQSLYFATHHANKSAVCIDLEDRAGQPALRRQLADADIFIETTRPGTLTAPNPFTAELRRAFPALVILSISDFGQTGPYRAHQADSAVHMAMSGMLSRSGLPGRRPLLPPAPIAEESAAMQAAWCALVAYWAALDSGQGDHLDFSLFDATAQVLDPALGPTGSAANGQPAAAMVARDRPEPFPLYPIFPCLDGHVRITVLAPRQWAGMFAWLGSPPAFADAAYARMATRAANAGALNAAIARLFQARPAAELVAEGQRRGVPMAAVRHPGQVLQDPHLRARAAFTPLALGAALGACPDGPLQIDGQRMGIRQPAPEQADPHFAWPARAARPAPRAPQAGASRPLQGLRVLDLGVIVAGAETGRLFADQGADVIKVENRAFPDGLRQSLSGLPMSVSFALGHRGKRSLGIDLKSEAGRALFKQLVGQADLVLSNFKPGTLEDLGLGADVLRALNPRIVLADSSAHGSTGPMSRTMGYGPLVRASVGLTHLWRDPDEADGFSDGITIYPDHVAARVLAVGALAALLQRRSTRQGSVVSVSQAEVFLHAMATEFLLESLQPGTLVPAGNASPLAAPHGVYACAGDDEWCVVSVTSDVQWAQLCACMGRPELATDPELATQAARLQHRERADAILEHWMRGQAPTPAAQLLQQAGVPAGAMLRLSEFLQEPHLQARGYFRTLEQPGLGTVYAENGPVRAERLPDPALRPAPVMGQHTREVMAQWLGLAEAEIDALLAAEVLEGPAH